SSQAGRPAGDGIGTKAVGLDEIDPVITDEPDEAPDSGRVEVTAEAEGGGGNTGLARPLDQLSPANQRAHIRGEAGSVEGFHQPEDHPLRPAHIGRGGELKDADRRGGGGAGFRFHSDSSGPTFSTKRMPW